jgi:taurine dioxygenase
MLSCVMTPAEGGDTLFCSTQVGWETLPAATQARAEGRQVVHNFNQHNDRLLRMNPGAFKPFTQEERDRWPDRVHDLVQVHPKSGRRHFFVTPTLMKSVSGLDDAEAQALVDELIAHATHPDRVYRHRWRVGDVVLWDNRATLHSATPANYKGGHRLMHRSYAYTS